MIENKLKAYIGELVFNNAVLAHRVEELEKQVADLQPKTEVPSE